MRNKNTPASEAAQTESRQTSPLRALRLDAGLTQAELSRLSGVNARQIRSIESGSIKIGNVTLANAAALAAALGIHAEELLNEEEMKFYWSNETFGQSRPEDAEELFAAANREIDAYISRRELDAEDADDYDTICLFSDCPKDFYNTYHKLPAQAIKEDGFRIILNNEIAAAVADALEAHGLEWTRHSGLDRIIDEIDVGRQTVEEDLPAPPTIIEQYIKGFLAEFED